MNDNVDLDDDNDGINDIIDSKRFDRDNDEIPDAVDFDNDNDGLTDSADMRPYDHDNDGINDASDTDDDNDGPPNASDAKPYDHDNDGINDASDTDDDNDGIPDASDTKPYDHDNDGINDDGDLDDDNDGLTDIMDVKPFDYDNDGIEDDADFDDDDDGFEDAYDPDQFRKNTIRVGHRGAKGYAPENTLKSFQKAIELGVDMVELDVHTCKTGELIVMHDSTVDRTTNGSGHIANLTFDELRSLDAGEGEKIPTVEEVLNLVNKKIRINIEIKSPGIAASLSELIYDYVKNYGWKYEQFLVSSFNINELKIIHNINQNIRTGVNLGFAIDYTNLDKDLKFWSVSLNKKFASKLYIDGAHAIGWKVFVWTVNEKDEIDDLKALEVDGIISDFPDRI